MNIRQMYILLLVLVAALAAFVYSVKGPQGALFVVAPCAALGCGIAWLHIRAQQKIDKFFRYRL